MPTVETFGEVFPGLLIESIADPKHPEQLLLETWDGKRARTARTVERGGVEYVSPALDSRLARSVLFAPESSECESAADLILGIRDSIRDNTPLGPTEANILTGFSVASWFCDSMSVAPLLCLSGPSSSICEILRVGSCFCRRSVLVGDIECGGLQALAHGLGATLLISQRQLGSRVQRTLLASARRGFGVMHGKIPLELYGARAFSRDDGLKSELGLTICTSPITTGPGLSLSEAEQRRIIQCFQPKLLRNRMLYLEQIGSRPIDCCAFVPELREEARTWLAPIMQCPEVSASVHAELLRKSQSLMGARFTNLKCVVIEAALCFCHRAETKCFFVGELTDTVNAILNGRHEELQVKPRKVGSVLRDLGIYSHRDTPGFKIELTESIREQIHEQANRYQVPPAADGVWRCCHCRERSAAPDSDTAA